MKGYQYMNSRKNVAQKILTIAIFVICLLTLRYFCSVFYNAVKISGSIVQPDGDGGYINVLHADLVLRAIASFLPFAIPYLISFIFVIVLCIGEWSNKLGYKRRLSFCSVISAGSFVTEVFLWLKESDLKLACFMEVRLYNPFGLLGDNPVNLVFLTNTNGYMLIKYIILGIIMILSLILLGIYTTVYRNKAETES